MKQLLSKVCSPVGKDGFVKCGTTPTACPKEKKPGQFNEDCFQVNKELTISIYLDNESEHIYFQTIQPIKEIEEIIREKLGETCILKEKQPAIDPSAHFQMLSRHI